jgi:hypothetical protein
MDTKSRYDLIMKKPTEEIITDADLKGILETFWKPAPRSNTTWDSRYRVSSTWESGL